MWDNTCCNNPSAREAGPIQVHCSQLASFQFGNIVTCVQGAMEQYGNDQFNMEREAGPIQVHCS
jgi:ssRNA-specific RNase YbeY (16S rRNA maturation enzyme)